MGYQIIKQPNGLFAIWSTIVDDFAWFDCSPDDIIEIFVKEKRQQITQFVNEKVALLNEGKPAYYQFTMSWEEAKKEASYPHNFADFEIGSQHGQGQE